MSSEKDKSESSVASDGSPESTGIVASQIEERSDAADLKAVFGEDAIFAELPVLTADGRPATRADWDRLRANSLANAAKQRQLRAEQNQIRAKASRQAEPHQSDVDRPATAEDSPS